MATITNKPLSTVLSSSLSSITVSSSAEYVLFELTTVSGVNIYLNNLYTSGGKATLHEVNSIIESYLRQHPSPYLMLNLKVSDAGTSTVSDSCSFTVIYCEFTSNTGSAQSVTIDTFLTNRYVRRVPSDFTDSVNMLVPEKMSSATDIHVSSKNKTTGELYSDTLRSAGNTMSTLTLVMVQVSSSDILSRVASLHGISADNVNLITFSVVCGNRSVSYYIDDSLREDNVFIFRNMFNVSERIYLPCSTTDVAELEQQTAVLEGTVSFYDRDVTETYKLSTGPLSVREARTIKTLLRSRDISRVVLYPNGAAAVRPVIITDISCEVSDDPEEPATVEFTYRYTDTRPFEILAPAIGVFAKAFNYSFS
ncbi:MAG: hypothetical protein NC217_07720 [Muribaculaceae bacterium]|nr:hypothetical protein [Muribaculaceae bacterium]